MEVRDNNILKITTMKTLRLINTLGVGAMTLMLAASCESGDKKFGYDGETSVYFANAGYERVVELGEDQEADLTDDNNHIINIKAFCGGGYGNSSNITVDHITDPSLCDGYTIKGSDIDVMPSSYYEIENKNQFTIASGSLMGGVKVHLTDAFFADPKSCEQGYVIPVQLVKATGVDKILEDKSMTFCRVKFVNPWHATYLRRGKDVINGTTSYRHTQYMEKGEIINVVTKGLNQAQVTVAVKDAAGVAHDVALLLSFNGDDCTITSNTEGVTASGSGKFVKKCEDMGGIQRNALYLDYKFQSDVLGKVETTDTLVVRNRGIKYAIFTPDKK